MDSSRHGNNNLANINVVVRCRGRNRQEIDAKSSVIVKIPNKNGSNNQNSLVCESTNNDNIGIDDVPTEISINTTNETGIAGDISSRTYTVDKVYGPETDQSQFFQGTAEPLFQEFLKGYNCTMFAYGQTGTGKTYTMHGDERIDSNTGSFSPNAGIIPRILYTLFDTLNCLQGADFIIKCSFLELYNEELRDLFAVDDLKKLRIYEQQQHNNNIANTMTNRCSIMTQNLEEVVLRDAEHGMRLLQQGINKRQVASTKMNDVSSRSHTIFSINLFKQQAGEGNEIKEFRISKFNLVDLAGSENINRSGALNQRAREAGSINQSLLTLGRVINGLVDGDNHIPYRESKLTRLLQDSLGGKTKTVLIANISPAKLNCEETLSTLQYASKAKNIKNKPQIGTLVVKNMLVKDLGLELARLKADLNATRLKNGIYIDEANYNEIQNEAENLKTENSEVKSKNEMLQRQVESLHRQLQEANLSNTKKNYELENLNKIISNLYEKIDRQSANHQNLIQNSTRFKTVIDLMNENIEFLMSNDKSMKANLQKLITEQMNAEKDNMQRAVSNLLNIDGNSFSTQLETIKEKINEEFSDMKKSTEQFSIKVAKFFISKLPDICIEMKSELDYLQDITKKLQHSIESDSRGINQSLGQYHSAVNKHLSPQELSSLLTQEYNEQIEEELQIQESYLVEKMITLVQENTKKQRQELSHRLITKNSELIKGQIKKVNMDHDILNSQVRSKFGKLQVDLTSNVADADNKMQVLSSQLTKTIESSASTQLEVQSELSKLNFSARQASQTGDTENDNDSDVNFEDHKPRSGYETMIDSMKLKVLQDYEIVNKEAKNISGANDRLEHHLSNFQNEILLDNQENIGDSALPNDSRTINKLVVELGQESSKINKDSLPTDKTPKHRHNLHSFLKHTSPENNKFYGADESNTLVFDALHKNKTIYTPNRSPSKRVISALKKQSLNFQDLIKIRNEQEELEEEEEDARIRDSPMSVQSVRGKNGSATETVPKFLKDITAQLVPNADLNGSNDGGNNNMKSGQTSSDKFTKPRSTSVTNFKPRMITNSKTVLHKDNSFNKGNDTQLLENKVKRSGLKRARTIESLSGRGISSSRIGNVASPAPSSSSSSVSLASGSERLVKQRKLKSMLPLRKSMR